MTTTLSSSYQPPMSTHNPGSPPKIVHVTSVRVGGQWDQLIALDDAGRLWSGNYVATSPSYWHWTPINPPELQRRH